MVMSRFLAKLEEIFTFHLSRRETMSRHLKTGVYLQGGA